MAETYIALTKPEIIDENWPPKIAEPVNTDKLRYFPAAASDPVANSQEVTVRSGHQPVVPGQVISNEETKLTPSGAPVSNDHGPATIHRDATARGIAPPLPPLQHTSDVSMHPGGQPLHNDVAATIHHIAAPLPVQEPPRKVPPGTTISNEINVSFVPSAPPPSTAVVAPPPVSSPGRSIAPPVDVPADPNAPMNVNGDVFLAPSHARHQVQTVNNESVQFYAVGQTMQADNDRTFGASGDTNKVAGRDDVTFGGAGGTMSVGGTDVTQAASGDTTKAAGLDDTIMTATHGMIGNHETQTGAKGDPTSNSQFVGVQNGAVGKPIQRNRS